MFRRYANWVYVTKENQAHLPVSIVGLNVGSFVGSSVIIVGLNVGSLVGSSVINVGDSVGYFDGDIVGSFVRIVGDNVGIYVHQKKKREISKRIIGKFRVH
jgi:hypothetical protein